MLSRAEPLHVPARAAPRERTGLRPMLPYYCYRTGEALVRVLPRSLAYAIGTGIADIMLATVPRKFDPLRDNLRHVLPDADARTLRRTLRGNVRNLTRSWIDVMEMPWRPRRVAARLRTFGADNYNAALRDGRGIAGISAHFGPWEAGLAAWNGGGGRMALLAEELRPRQLFERIAGARGNLGVRVIPLDVEAMRRGDPQAARRAGAVAMREVVRLLRSGGVLAMAIDRDLIGNGTRLPFFGVPTRIPIGVVEVAIRCNAAVIPIALMRRRDGVDGIVFPEIVYERDAPLEEEVLRVATEVLSIWEKLIREHPEQWTVLDRVWPAA